MEKTPATAAGEPARPGTGREPARPAAAGEPAPPAAAPEPAGLAAAGEPGRPEPDPAPEFGPRGYLPPRAAKRARKIVLRERMGLQWPVAAVVAGVVVVVVGVVYVLRSGPPAAPFTSLGPVETVTRGDSAVLADAAGDPVLVVGAQGRVRAFAAPPAEVAWCDASRRLESPTGQVWTPDGILVGGDGVSLRPIVSTVYDGDLYVDPSSGSDLPADPRGERPACA